MINLKEILISEALDVIREADLEKAFLPSISEPDFSVEKFLSEEELDFRIYGSFDERNRLVGFILIELTEDNIVSIGPMYIIKAFRRKGFGKLQVEKIIEWALKNKSQGLSTKTWSKNIASRKIFESLGFKLLKEKLKARINGDSTIKYYLELENPNH